MSTSAKYNGIFHSIFFGGLQKLSVPLSGVLITMILTKGALTVDEMGVWAIFMTITSIQETVRQGLVKTSLIKYLNYCQPEEQKYVLTIAFLLNALITTITALLLFFFASHIANLERSPQLKQMLYIFQAGMFIMIFFSHFEWVMYAKVKFKGLFWVYFFRQGSSLLFVASIFFLTHKVSLNTLVVIYNVSLLAGTLVGFYYVRPLLTYTFAFSKEWLWKMLHFGKYVFGSNLSTLVFRSADQLMVSPISKSVAYTASLNISARVITLTDLPSQTLGDVLFPRSARKENSDNPAMAKYYYEKTVGASLFFILPLVLAILLLPKLIIIILATKQYYNAIPYLRMISVTAIFLAFLKQYGVIIDSTGRPKINFITITIIGAIQVIACYFFIKYFGLMGAGYALLCTHLIGFIMTQAILKKYFNVNFLNCFRYAFKFYPEMFKIITERVNLKWKMQ
jgi:lipopolysaccharide exporter